MYTDVYAHTECVISARCAPLTVSLVFLALFCCAWRVDALTSYLMTECSAIVLAKCAYASTMVRGSTNRCALPVLKLAAQSRSVGLGAETLQRLSALGWVTWVRVGGWRATAAGIAALAEHVGGPVFEA